MKKQLLTASAVTASCNTKLPALSTISGGASLHENYSEPSLFGAVACRFLLSSLPLNGYKNTLVIH